MKISSLLPAVMLFTALHTYAQVGHKTYGEKLQHSRQLLHHILAKQAATNAAAKTTTTSERLIGQADYLNGPTLVDSMAMFYSGSKGSVFNLQFMSFLDPAAPDFFPIGEDDPFGFSSNWGLLFPHNQAPLVYSDSTLLWSINATTFSYGFLGTIYHIYDAKKNLLDDQFRGVPGIIWQRDICTYNSASNVTSIIELGDNMSTGGLPWDSSDRADLTYNTLGQLTVDSISYFGTPAWTPVTKYVYIYDGSGRITKVTAYSWTAGWNPAGEDRFTYYTSGNLKTYESYYDITTMELAYRDSFSYTAGYSFFTYSNASSYGTGGLFSDSTIINRHVSTSGLPDTIYTDDYAYDGSLITHDMEVFTYNTYRDPVNRFAYTSPTMTPPTIYAGQTNYYYATYDAASTPEVIAENNTIEIYPDPATNIVYINNPTYTFNAQSTIDIFNISGQKVNSQHITWKNETEQVSVSSLLPGIYIIAVKENNGKLMHRQQIVKL